VLFSSTVSNWVAYHANHDRAGNPAGYTTPAQSRYCHPEQPIRAWPAVVVTGRVVPDFPGLGEPAAFAEAKPSSRQVRN
jgi:hypothetical protein